MISTFVALTLGVFLPSFVVVETVPVTRTHVSSDNFGASFHVTGNPTAKLSAVQQVIKNRDTTN